MKRLTAVLLLLCFLLAGLPAGVLAEEDNDVPEGFILIQSRKDLEAVAQNPEGKYFLAADIDMKGKPWKPIPFSGELEGNGHTLYNMSVESAGDEHRTTIDGNHKEYDTVFAGLFSTLENAQVRNLHLLGIRTDLFSEENCFAGMLCGYALNAVVSGCSAEGTVYLRTPSKMAGVSGLCGFGTGLIQDCNVDATLIYVDTNRGQNCEEFLGGVLACGYMDVEDTAVKLDGYASVHGYVHNGGFIGMHHIHDRGVSHNGYVKHCSMEGKITFYEDNTDRRAYCKAFVGELLHKDVELIENKTVSFQSVETHNYKEDLLPHTCSPATYVREVTQPLCDTFGYVTYTCSACGYSYRADYTPPEHQFSRTGIVEPTCTEEGFSEYVCSRCGISEKRDFTPPRHVPGEWKTVREPDYGQEGRKVRPCAVCGEILEEETIPPLTGAESVSVPESLQLYKGETAKLQASVLPADASNPGVIFTSENPAVAQVDAQGNVLALQMGTACIRCASADGMAESFCTVEVRLTLWQWIVHIFTGGARKPPQ